LTFGNGHLGGSAGTLFFTASMDDDGHALFGAIQAPGQLGADTAGSGAFDPHAPGEPGDYPLPPRIAPAFGSSHARPTPVADLLPVRESSLLLAPTLFTMSQGGTIDTYNSMGSLVSQYQSASVPSSGAMPHSLDSLVSPRGDLGARAEEPSPPVAGLSDRNGVADDSSSAVFAALLESHPSDGPDPRASLPSRHVDEVLITEALRRLLDPAEEPTAWDPYTTTRETWAHLLNVFLALSLPMTLAYVEPGGGGTDWQSVLRDRAGVSGPSPS
jgi:hypothetical protein